MTTSASTECSEVEHLHSAVDAVGSIDVGSLDDQELRHALVEVQRAADRLGAQAALLSAEAAERELWRHEGAASAPSWIGRITGVGRGRARGAVELGEAMRRDERLSAAVTSGIVSPAAAGAVVPAMDDDEFADTGGQLIEELAGMTPSAAGRRVEAWRATADRASDDERRETARERRELRLDPLGDGMVRVSGIIPAETARSVRQALAHLADQQRNDGSGRTRPQRMVDALGDLAAAHNRGEITGGRNLPRIIVTMTLDQLESRSRVAADGFGEVVTSVEIDRMCCDATIHRCVTDQTGAVLNFGRGRRTASPQQFLALVARDRGCRHPGCDRPPTWCEAHHLREFAARGGLTDVDEMALLCHHHHHALHEGGWTLRGDPCHLVFTGPDGRTLHSRLSHESELPDTEEKTAA